ncbi:hypothetical protein [Staphylococcus hominis]|uniref:hypothetical protein n=1 Tax=Staphylococcus hominis TaxID=1290 RepID=UPI0011A899F9|nr:hypothetical protein [Staphylococcus hominis]
MNNLNEQKFVECIKEYRLITNQLKEEAKYNSEIPQDSTFYNVCGYYLFLKHNSEISSIIEDDYQKSINYINFYEMLEEILKADRKVLYKYLNDAYKIFEKEEKNI